MNKTIVILSLSIFIYSIAIANAAEVQDSAAPLPNKDSFPYGGEESCGAVNVDPRTGQYTPWFCSSYTNCIGCAGLEHGIIKGSFNKCDSTAPENYKEEHYSSCIACNGVLQAQGMGYGQKRCESACGAASECDEYRIGTEGRCDSGDVCNENCECEDLVYFKIKDYDLDGVPNEFDKCPETELFVEAGDDGCQLYGLLVIDNDLVDITVVSINDKIYAGQPYEIELDLLVVSIKLITDKEVICTASDADRGFADNVNSVSCSPGKVCSVYLDLGYESAEYRNLGKKTMYLSCDDGSGNKHTKNDNIEIPVTIVDTTGPRGIGDAIPSRGFPKTVFAIDGVINDKSEVNVASLKGVVKKNNVKISDINLIMRDIKPTKMSFETSWDSTGAERGMYTIEVSARDALGNGGIVSIPVHIVKNSDKFRIYAVAVNYDNMNNYLELARDRLQVFKDASPFKEPLCSDGLEMNILNKNCKCASILPESAMTILPMPVCDFEVIKCVENEGITNYDLIVAITDDYGCVGYANPPIALCGSSEIAHNCVAHEIAHHFKLCDEYSKSYWEMENKLYSKLRLLSEKTPFSGCGNHYPETAGIGEATICNTDCSTNSKACKETSCGLKIGGAYPPYDVSIMGGGGAWEKKCKNTVANQKGYGKEAYDFMLGKIREAGYCE